MSGRLRQEQSFPIRVSKLEVVRMRVLGFVTKKKSATLREVVMRFGYTIQTAQSALRTLVDSGHLSETDGLYSPRSETK